MRTHDESASLSSHEDSPDDEIGDSCHESEDNDERGFAPESVTPPTSGKGGGGKRKRSPPPPWSRAGQVREEQANAQLMGLFQSLGRLHEGILFGKVQKTGDHSSAAASFDRTPSRFLSGASAQQQYAKLMAEAQEKCSRLRFSVPQDLMPLVAGLIDKHELAELRKRATQEANRQRNAAWAAKAADRPYQRSDLAAGKPGATEYYKSLSLADLKSECTMYGLKVSGSKQALLDSLVRTVTSTRKW